MRLLQGDCSEVLKTLPSDTIDSCVTDPPYHLVSIVKRFAKSPARNEATVGKEAYGRHARGFMGKSWDGGDIAFQPNMWAEVVRVLKPGGHLLAFGGTRTYHRMACAIEDAGFEIRDQIGWVYGSGFPKSHNMDGAWEGWGTALKPAWEPIVLARKPLIGTVAANVLAHGTGAINVDGCRVHGDDAQGGTYIVKRLKPGATLEATGGSWRPEVGPEYHGEMKPGRWPANIIHDGSEEVTAAFPQAVGQIADASRSSSRKTQNVYGDMKRGNGRDGEPSAESENEWPVGFKMKPGARRGDAGSAARFFYCAKASKSDRGEGNTHPTVKPTALMQYLCRMVTPPGGTVLDPFLGSGSTGLAAQREGFEFIGIERETEYMAIAQRRLIPRYASVFDD